MLLCAMGLIPIIGAVVSVSCPSDLVNCLSVILKENFFEVDLAVQEMLIAKKGYDFAKWLFNHTGKFPRVFDSALPCVWEIYLSELPVG